MSAEALQAAQAFSHPDVKGSARRLLEVIAEQIPPGDTMTPEIPIPELATLMGYQDNAVRRARKTLVRVGVVRIVNGGQGEVSRYELMLLPNAQGYDPALPLRADLRPAPKVRRPRTHEGPDLFDEPQVRSSDIDQNDRSWWRYFDHFDRSTQWLGFVLRSFWAMLVRNFDHFDRSTPDATFPQGVPLTDSATTKYQDLDPEVVEKPVVVARARDGDEDDRQDVEAFLGWFVQTYPTYHHGAQCTIHRHRDRGLVYELLRRGRGSSVADLQAMTIELWSITSDGVINSNPWWIAERVTVRDIYVLHRKADFLDREVRKKHATQRAADDVWSQVLERIATKVNRHTFHSWFLETVLVAQRGHVLEVTTQNPDRAEIVGDWIRKHHGDVVREALEEVQAGLSVTFVADTPRKFG